MLRVAPLVAAMAMFALSAQADEMTGSRLQAGLKEFEARLALTSEQNGQVRTILREHVETQVATLGKYDVRDRGGADTVDLERMRALRAELRANSAKIEGRLSEVLSATQMAEFKRIRAEQEDEFRERVLSRRLDEIGATLKLTPEQADRVRPVLKEHFEAQMAVLEKHGVDFGGRERLGLRTLRRLRRDMSANNARTAKRLSAVLSESQMSAYEALQAEQRKKLRALLFAR